VRTTTCSSNSPSSSSTPSSSRSRSMRDQRYQQSSSSSSSAPSFHCYSSQSPPPAGTDPLTLSRRSHLLLLTGTTVSLVSPVTPAASASALPGFADKAWEAMGGGPSDLTFPESWLGVWDVSSVLVGVETPLGEDLIPNMRSVRRAQQEDLNKRQTYQVQEAILWFL
jgi:hypothetical protein